MQLNALLKEEDAVSPVIGVILMVAITVILAAVIGTFVLGLGDQVQETSPNAQFDWDQSQHPDNESTEQLTLSFESGQSVEADRLSLSVDSDSVAVADLAGASNASNWEGSDNESELAAGSSITIGPGSSNGFVDGDEVSLLWNAEGGGQSDTLTTHEVS